MRAVLLILLLGLTGCTTTRSLVSCDNASLIRQFAVNTLATLDKLCPVAAVPTAEDDAQ